MADENAVKSIRKKHHLIQPDDGFNIQFTSVRNIFIV